MMSRSKLGMEFASRSPWRKTTAALMAVGVIASACTLWQRHILLEHRTMAASQFQEHQQSTAGAQPPGQSVVKPEAKNEADRLIAGLQRPWEPMLNALQSAIKDDVVVYRIQPEAEAFRLRIHGQADSSQAFIEFVQRLQSDASWRRVEPLSEARQRDNATRGGKPVVFQLMAEWRRP